MQDQATPLPAGIQRRLYRILRPHLRLFFAATLAMSALGATEPLLPWLLQLLFEADLGAHDEAAMRFSPWLIPPALVLLFVLRGVLTYVGKVGLNAVAHRVVLDLRRAMFATLVELPVRFYNRHAAGSIVSKFTFDATQLSQSAIRVLDVLVKDIVSIVALLLFVLYLNWQLAAVSAVLAPLVYFIIVRVSATMRALSLRLQATVGDLNEVTQEAIAGQYELKVFEAQAYEVERFARVAEATRRIQMKVIRAAAAKVPLIQLILASGIAAAILVAMHAIEAGRMQTEEFVAFVTAVVLILPPVRRLTTVNEDLQRGLAAAQSVFGLLDEPPEDADRGATLSRARGDLVFDAVTFRHEGQERLALAEVTLSVRAGESVALVGSSGAGKTTLVNLVPRFHEPIAGRILLDGVDIAGYSLRSLRRHIALVGQQVVLFDDTLYNNIAYGALREAPRDQVFAAARAAHVLEFAERLPDGLETRIGANGVRLSGGQRQRLAIARALLKDAPILILDEATSALDAETERFVQDGLAQLRAGRTSLIVAHRLSTIESADRIVVLDQGRIVETGDHAALLAAGGSYARLYRHQFND
ncbi:MAG: lipid A export permease/ATP-binding protein MsbA [Gammaproteobacteria bacterium]|nr:lipid A export permease/ATP-binding protein MsbA [Gammaproteobacteria bacterium]